MNVHTTCFFQNNFTMTVKSLIHRQSLYIFFYASGQAMDVVRETQNVSGHHSLQFSPSEFRKKTTKKVDVG